MFWLFLTIVLAFDLAVAAATLVANTTADCCPSRFGVAAAAAFAVERKDKQRITVTAVHRCAQCEKC